MSTQVAARLDDELEERLESFREGQVIRPKKSEVVRTALDDFLEKQGY